VLHPSGTNSLNQVATSLSSAYRERSLARLLVIVTLYCDYLNF